MSDREEREEIRRLINMAKLLFVVMIALIIVELMSCTQEAKAATITGETQLAGISLLMQEVIDKTGNAPYPEDLELLAQVMFFENWSTDTEREAARLTGAVVLNRVKSPNFPGTIKAVLYQKNPTQYTTTHKFYSKQIPPECYKLAVHLLKYGAPDVPANVIYQSTHEEFGSGVWREINGEFFNYE